MNRQLNIDSLADAIKNIYEQDPLNAHSAIESYLAHELEFNNITEKQSVIEQVRSYLGNNNSKSLASSFPTDDQFLRFCSILLGHHIETTDLQIEDLQQRLTESLTAIFETLNQLIRTINLTLLEDGQTQETIRFLIGEQLDGSIDTTPLEEHLNQIRTAFVTSHRAFKKAMHVTVENILKELDPDTLKNKDNGGLGFNPLRKVDSFNRYVNTYKNCSQWFESGRCMEEFLRSFEQQCAAMTNNPNEVTS